jgi:hypothetical protein
MVHKTTKNKAKHKTICIGHRYAKTNYEEIVTDITTQTPYDEVQRILLDVVPTLW